jgi:phosphotransferase system HPr-like phosphotransfer protein
MESSKFTMILSMPLSGRVVNKIVSETNALKSMVYLDLGTRTVDMKSILGILSADCKVGMEITVVCLAHDKSIAENDCKVMERLLKSGDF